MERLHHVLWYLDEHLLGEGSSCLIQSAEARQPASQHERQRTGGFSACVRNPDGVSGRPDGGRGRGLICLGRVGGTRREVNGTMISTRQLWIRIVVTVVVMGGMVGYVVHADGRPTRTKAGFALVEPVGGPAWDR